MRVDSERCTGCGACMDVCPVGAIEMTAGMASIRHDLCNECQACIDACAEGAILPAGELVPVVEGEVVSSEREIAVQQPVGVSIRTAQNRGLTALGAVLTFVGREILPRAATSLLEAWDRRQATSASGTQPAGDVGKSNGSQAGGRRQRRRRHRGG